MVNFVKFNVFQISLRLDYLSIQFGNTLKEIVAMYNYFYSTCLFCSFPR